MTMRPELIDELLKDCSDPREVRAAGGLLKQLTKAIIERCLETELDAHLGYPRHGRREEGSANVRNGSRRKTLKGAQGEIELAVPRDRQTSIRAAAHAEASDPLRGLRGQNPGALRSRHDAPEIFKLQFRTSMGWRSRRPACANIAEAVMEEVRQWQTRPLDAVSPIVSVD